MNSQPHREDREEGGVAQVAVVSRSKCGQVLHEARILIDGLAPDRSRHRGVAGASAEVDIQPWLTNVIESGFYRHANMAPVVSRNHVSESKSETRSDLTEINRSCSVERI